MSPKRDRMSRRRGPRGRGRERRRESTNDRSQRVLQVALIAAGILFLLVGAIITAGGGGALDLFGASQSDETNSGTDEPATSGNQQSSTTEQTSSETDTPTPTATPTTTAKPTTTTTATATPTATPTTTATPTATATRTAASGGLRITEKTDDNGNGYVSDFNLEVNADTSSASKPYFIVKINGEVYGYSNELRNTANGVFTITLDGSKFEKYGRGQLQVSVELADKDTDGTINSWTTTVNYEPE